MSPGNELSWSLPSRSSCCPHLAKGKATERWGSPLPRVHPTPSHCIPSPQPQSPKAPGTRSDTQEMPPACHSHPGVTHGVSEGPLGVDHCPSPPQPDPGFAMAPIHPMPGVGRRDPCSFTGSSSDCATSIFNRNSLLYHYFLITEPRTVMTFSLTFQSRI